jgi:group I intron endonuclease
MYSSESGIYLITIRRPNKLPLYYVGQSQRINRRFIQHRSLLKNNKHYNKRLQRAINKYGVDSVSFQVLENCCLDELDEVELWWLEQMVGFDRVCNSGTDPVAPLRGSKLSDEHKNKIASAISGDRHYSRSRGPMPVAHREAISRGGKGKVRTDESRRRYSDCTKGELNPMFGVFGNEHARSQPVRGTNSITGEIVEFQSMNLAESSGFIQESISRCCSGIQKLHKGFAWERISRSAS